jgi:hypothetical protein
LILIDLKDTLLLYQLRNIDEETFQQIGANCRNLAIKGCVCVHALWREKFSFHWQNLPPSLFKTNFV